MKFNAYLEEIPTYEAGKPIELVVREYGIDPDEVIKLASNENPLGCSPKAVEALRRTAPRAHLYPDDSMYSLKKALAERFAISPDHLIIGAGSDQVIEFASHVRLAPGTAVLCSRVTFAMYEIYARQFGARVLRTESREHRSDEFIALMRTHRPEIVYLCTPNNPTGEAMRRREVLEIVEAADPETLVVVDGAYMEYAAAKDSECALDPAELSRYGNVLYLGTFSKAYGLGGMRVGYGIADPDLIGMLYKVRPPFNVTTLSLAAAEAALQDQEFVARTLALNAREMQRYEAFAKKRRIGYIPSYTNFITYMLEGGLESGELYRRLMRRGIIVRDLGSYGMNALRITIGTPEQNDRLFEALEKELK